jgi:hypothetical protein
VVHGTWQQQLGRHQLIATRTPALADGLERALGRGVAPPPLDMAFHGHLFPPPVPDKSHHGCPADTEVLLAGLDEAEIAEIATGTAVDALMIVGYESADYC